VKIVVRDGELIDIADDHPYAIAICNAREAMEKLAMAQSAYDLAEKAWREAHLAWRKANPNLCAKVHPGHGAPGNQRHS
jgi:hypothetical protein